MNNSANIIAAIGLALGGIFGLAGAAFGLAGAAITQPNLQAFLWAIDGAGLVMELRYLP